MRTADMVKSKFYSARDVKGAPPLVLTIADVTEELMGRGQGRNEAKCFLWFNETLKGLQLNKTRVAILEMAYGPDSALWVGKRVRLSFDPTVIFGGQAVGGVRLQTPPGVVYNGAGAPAGAWGDAPAPVPGRPPPPVWDEKRQMYVNQPTAAAPVKQRPPPPVFNEATGEWETVNPSTGEIAPPVHQRPATISERVNAGHPPADSGDWGALPPNTGQPTEDWNDDIPF